MMLISRDGGPAQPSIGASERAPFVSQPQGSQQQEQHRDATRGAKHQSRAQTRVKKTMRLFFGVETNECAKVASS
jgi:hypothetical protein